MRLVICGIATDICVKATAEDALKCGFEIVILKKACKGVDEQAVGRTLKEIAARENASIVDDAEQLWKMMLERVP
jgi:nicotinamidase-related amidase